MGWSVYDSPAFTKEVVARELARPQQDWPREDGRVFRAERYSLIGSELWILLKHEAADGTVEHDVARYLLQSGGRGSGWGFKDVPPREGDSAPAYILNANLDPEYYGDWVAWVTTTRAEHRAKAVKLLAGMTVRYGETSYRLDECLGRRGWAVTDTATGAQFRMLSRQVAQAEVIGSTKLASLPAKPIQMELAA